VENLDVVALNFVESNLIVEVENLVVVLETRVA